MASENKSNRDKRRTKRYHNRSVIATGRRKRTLSSTYDQYDDSTTGKYNKGYGLVSFDDENNFDFNNKLVINAKGKDAIDQIIDYWNKNKGVVTVSSIIPLIDNEFFIDSVIKEKIRFISQEEPILSKKVCSLMHYINKEYFGNTELGKYRIEEAISFAEKVGPIIDMLKEEGFNSSHAIAKELNKRDILSPRGRPMSNKAVLRISKRWDKIKQEKFPKPE